MVMNNELPQDVKDKIASYVYKWPKEIQESMIKDIEFGYSLSQSKGGEDSDNFAISFACWVLYHPDAKALLASGVSASQLLEKYKSRPYIDQNTNNQ